MYCQKVCGEIDFSINEWNETSKALDLTDMSEDEKNEILFPPACKSQCFDCMAIVGARRKETRDLVEKTAR